MYVLSIISSGEYPSLNAVRPLHLLTKFIFCFCVSVGRNLVVMSILWVCMSASELIRVAEGMVCMFIEHRRSRCIGSVCNRVF